MNALTTSRIVAGKRLTFTWHGGEYIEVGRPYAVPFEVINVWSAGTNGARIPFEQDPFEREVDEWINDPETDHAANFAAAGIR